VGSYAIVAALVDPAGKLANYTVVSNNATLTISPAALAVTAASAARLYGDANPAFTGAISGIKNADNITASFSTVANAASAVGTYAIVPALADPTGKLGNYTVSSTNGVLTISQAPLSVSAANATRVYGDANPVFAGTILGLKNGDNITATYASVDPTSAVGTYSITPTLVDPSAKLGNYTVTSNTGTLTITPAPLSVVTANASRIYGDANPVFAGTILGLKNGDNITATYASVDPTSAVGTYSITPTLVDPTAKLGNYTVTSNTGTLTITPAPLSVVTANASRIYGDANPVFTAAITGLKNADSITATFTTPAIASSSIGTYAIVPALVDPATKLGNYTVTSSNGTLTITAAPLSVTAANASRIYGDANPVFTGTITGLKNADAITATYASAATAASSVGSYAIVPTLVDATGKLSNYSVTSNNGTLTVAAAVLNVSGANATRAYGSANPAFTGTITGLKNADAITATFAAAADATSAVGTYAIVPTLVDPAGKLANYSVVSKNGTLTVTPVALTVTVNNATRLFGDPNPPFSGTITGLLNGDVITATYSTTATPTSAVGSYPITATLVDPAAKLGNYTVVSKNGTLNINSKPASVAVLPATGTGSTQLFQFQYSDPAGATAIVSTRMIINTAQSFTGACSTFWDNAKQTLALVPDNGVGLGVAAPLGVAGTLQNTQCSVDLGASSVVVSGNNLTLNLAISFNPVFVGPKTTFMSVLNKFGQNSGWVSRGTWTIPASAPASVAVTPATGTGSTQAFQFQYSDPSGVGSIVSTRMIINAGQSFTNACSTFYDAAKKTLALVPDNGVGLGTPSAFGVAGTLSNSQCSIDMATSSAVASGNNLTINLAITFKPTFIGTKTTFMSVLNKFGLNSGWVSRGTWTVPAGAPSSVSVAPSAGTGSAQAFQFQYSDASGVGSIISARVIIGATQNFAAACSPFYDAVNKTLALVPDSGTGL